MISIRSLRPQFSLRTLLLVTALIAVGAKWWIGPHHVVETIDGVEHEYDYYRGFGWERVKHGVVITREPEVEINYKYSKKITIQFYEHGHFNNHFCELEGSRDIPKHLISDMSFWLSGGCMMRNGLEIQSKLDENDHQQLINAIQLEHEVLKSAGYTVIERTYSNDYIERIDNSNQPGGFF